ncbi:unnamed protein product, partial [Callosobruchus maculatus]
PGLSNITDPSYVDGRIVQIAVLKEVTLTRYVIRHQTQNQVNSERKMEDKDKKRGPNYTEKEKSTPKYAWPVSFVTLNL